MNVKKIMPQLITASITAIMLIVAFVLPKVSIPELSYPFLLFEKLGIYFDGAGYGIMDKSISLNGTYEFIISLSKCISANVMLTYALPVIYSILLIAALVIISKAASKTSYTWTVYLCAVLLPLVFADFVNLAFFKTLYAMPLILLSLLFICGVFLTAYKNNSVGIAGVVAATVLSVIYSCLGTVQAITAIVLGVLIIRLSKLSANKIAKILSIVLGCAVIVQSIAFAFTFKSFDYKQTLYNSVFYGVCKYDSVTALGLDKELDDFKEVYYGMKEDAEKYDLENNFYNKMSYKKIVKYYITHPVNAVKVISNQAKPAFFNNYKFGFTPYSSMKKSFIPTMLPVVLGIAIVYIILAIVISRKYPNLKSVCEFFTGFAVMWVVSLVATALYHGNCDITNNMVTFSLLFDILLLGGFIGGIRVVIKGQEEKKESFGITHE